MQCASKGHKYKCIKEVLDLCLLVMQPNVFIFFPFEMHCDAHYLDCCLVAWLPASHRLFICFVHIFFFFGRFHLIGKKNFLLIFRHTWTSALKRNNTQSVRIVAWLWSSFCMCSMFNHLFGCVCGNRWRQNMKKSTNYTLLIRTKCKFTFTEALMHERLQKKCVPQYSTA